VWYGATSRHHTISAQLKIVVAFGVGALIAAAFILAPEMSLGSIQGMIHNVFARTQEPVTVGGLSVMAIRHFKPFYWVLTWAYYNSPIVIRTATIAQAVAIIAWAVWTGLVARRNPTFALLAGTVGTLGTYTVLAPFSNPTYVLWWLPALLTLVFLAGRWYLQAILLSLAPLAFSLAILGPAAFFAPLSTYTDLLPANALSDNVISWYEAPGTLWGVTRGDDFFAPAALITIATLLWLFVQWMRPATTAQLPMFKLPH